MKQYNPASIEPKWQKVWEVTPQLYTAIDGDKSRDKYYVLVEFPYPSGEGLHTGHVRSYTAQDVIARRLRMMGKNVMYPIGWDAFGLPTENFAIKNKIRPQDATAQNVETFKRQIKELGISFDWSREINTTDPKYYKWTQWIFLQLYKAGLAYQAEIPINWCPKERIGLANEEVVGGVHERCGTAVEKKILKQWMLKITAYADRLIEGLKHVDYLEQIASQQVNWIGKSYGAEIDFAIGDRTLKVFTTRPDTLGGATFIVLAPEHPMVTKITTDDRESAVEEYVKKVQSESDLARQEQDKPKSGVFTGAVARNPLNGEEIPVWVADYVLMGYGTGAIMAVPAHDERDFAFAKQFDLAITTVVDGGELPYIGAGKIINTEGYDGMSSVEAGKKIIEDLTTKNKAKKTVKYKLRDWVFSRQHYWGEPIPIIHCEKCGIVPVPEKDLPVELPEIEAYEPTETGESPLANIADWVNTTCPTCGRNAKRETDTMPNWAGSSWYYLRYIDPNNDQALADAEKLKYWLPVDLYNGGMEHTTLHLLYSRFWHQFLYDQGYVPTPEPYAVRRAHGMVLAADGKKMSKSLGNVINPDDMIKKYGADATRLYEMFMGPYDQAIEWNEDKLAGVYRFLRRVWELSQGMLNPSGEEAPNSEDGTFATAIDRATHKTIKKIDDHLYRREFNTLVSTLMEFINLLNEEENKYQLTQKKHTELSYRTIRALTLLLAPLTPHIAEELWEMMGEKTSVHTSSWPKYDPTLIKDDFAVIIVQVNGKLRGEFIAEAGLNKDQLEQKAKEENTVQNFTKDAEIIKVITVPNRLVNFVVK